MTASRLPALVFCARAPYLSRHVPDGRRDNGAVVIILLTILAYLPVMRGGFFWDDYLLITDNPMIKAPHGLCRFWFTTEAPDYYPLTWSLLWLEWRLWGNHASGYHVVNVL